MSGLASWFGKVPSGSMKSVVRRDRRQALEDRRAACSRAMPLAASIATRIGRATLREARRRGRRSPRAGRPLACARAPPPAADSGSSTHALDVEDAVRAEIGRAPSRAQLHAVVLARVVAGGHVQPAVAVLRADREVGHRRRGEPDVDHVATGVAHALDHARRRSPASACACRARPPGAWPSGSARRRCRCACASAASSSVGYDAADVVGLEDPHGYLRRLRLGSGRAG